MRYEVRLSGSGGQGLVLAGIILGEAAAIGAGLEATQSQSYGPEARGGASRSDVIISDEPVDYPKVVNPDLLLALTQEACDKFAHQVKSDGVTVLDSYQVQTPPSLPGKVYVLPIIETAVDKTGKAITANIVALGAISAISDVVSREALEQAIIARTPKGTTELNLKAFEEGRKLVEAAREQSTG